MGPFDTLKTLKQSRVDNKSIAAIATDLHQSSGLRGFYRGGLPLLLGGGLMRSAQFGVHSSVLFTIQARFGNLSASEYWFGCVNTQVVVAGFCGGVGRGLVEGPFEM